MWWCTVLAPLPSCLVSSVSSYACPPTELSGSMVLWYGGQWLKVSRWWQPVSMRRGILSRIRGRRLLCLAMILVLIIVVMRKIMPPHVVLALRLRRN